MLSGHGLSFRHDGSSANVFSNVDIDVAPGERVALLGPSGRGKTTLARVLAGYEKPLTGSVSVEGTPLLGVSGFCPVQLVFQHPEKAVNPRWTMRKVLAESGLTDDAIVSDLGIESEWMGRFPNEVSGGELQRFCIARALTRKTRYLIADEMTTMLDAVTQAQLWTTVMDWATSTGAGVLVVSHDASLIAELCHRVIELD